MTPRPGVSASMGRAAVVTVTLAIGSVLPWPGVAEPSAVQNGASASQAVPAQAALEEFQKRLQAYLELREALSAKVRPLSPTADSAELTARQESLAAAMKAARAGAKPGDLIPKLVAERIGATVAADRKRRPPVARSAALEDVPAMPTPAINRTYPADAALPTVPPLLLAQLPKLPDNLQYRFYGRHVLILDGDLQIIVDYVPNVLPPQ